MKFKFFNKKKSVELTPVDIVNGLTDVQVAERKAVGEVNNVKVGSTRSLTQIFISNTFTFFNMLCLAVFVWMVTVAESFTDIKNMGFIAVIALNWLIGIVQEIRAKMTVDKLTFISTPKVSVMRGGIKTDIDLVEVVKGDILLLESGNQICADGILVRGDVEVNESQLTGESEAIKKKTGDSVLSGSFVVSGRGSVEVTAVGDSCYINKLSKEAKSIKKQPSELIKSLMLIMKIIAIIIIPVAFFAFLSNYSAELNNMGIEGTMWSRFKDAFSYEAYRNAVFPTSTSIIGMIPSGMFLLTSVALAVGIMRLAKKNALIQELYSIEKLARVNLLCLDKTGTITDGTMSVKEIIPLSTQNEKEVKDTVASMQFALQENNPTAIALQNFFGVKEAKRAELSIPFSSDRKCSAVKFSDGMYVIGAPEYVGVKIKKELQKQIDQSMDKGYRCLLLAVSKTHKKPTIPATTIPVALVVIEDNIKSDCVATIKYFKDSDVDVRVISGDNPHTVSVIAKRVGIDNADKYISLQNMSDEEVRAIAAEYTVFGRVNPAQKKLLIRFFKERGKTVAMTGDGINDILAMKEADCSIAMANGSEATRSIANVVLLDSNFGSMPSIVAEGRRVINNIERSSTLFLTKTMFSLLFTLVLILWGRSFPMDPIQVSFVSAFAIGLPSFFMALEPNNNRIKSGFLKNVFKKIIPGAVATIIAVVVIMVFRDYGNLGVTDNELKTMCMIMMFIVFMEVACQLCKPFNLPRALMVAGITLIAAIVVFFSPLLPDTLNIYCIYTNYSIWTVSLVVFMALIALNVMEFVSFIIGRTEKRVEDIKDKLVELTHKKEDEDIEQENIQEN